jgi:formylglycine-generating enzyme required for sulfatase activity
VRKHQQIPHQKPLLSLHSPTRGHEEPFQEYLAGLYAAREGRADELVRQVGKSWWREVILVAAAIGSREFALKFFTALVGGDAVIREGEFVDQCLDEARYAVLDPFLDALRERDATPERQFAILRRLKAFEHPELLAICRELADSRHAELASLAREILQRAGIVIAQPGIAVAGGALESRVDKKTGMAFILIPPGEFDMGSNDGKASEKPVRRVHLANPFWLGKYPVTNAEFQRFLEDNPAGKPPAYWNDSKFNDPRQPVVGVSWDDAQAFCQWAGCRLPTEAEWEYACRAGTKTVFYFGDALSSSQANFEGNFPYGGAAKGPYLEKTSPVGSYAPNAFGLYDMHGNVWEWCQDHWHDNYKAAPVDGSAWLDANADKGAPRVVRGGGWNGNARYCRSACRYGYEPASRSIIVGFRLLLAPSSTASPVRSFAAGAAEPSGRSRQQSQSARRAER